jgi:hypothetical protein
MTAMLSDVYGDFWKDFWPNFYSNIVSGLILTYLITLAIDWFRKPKLEVVLSIGTSTQNRKVLNFHCINTGRTGLMAGEIEWYFYFNSAFKLQDESISWFKTFQDNQEVYELNGTSNRVCLPNSSCLLASYNVVLDTANFPYKLIDEAPFYYSLTTTKGEKPKSNIFKRDKETDFKWDSAFTKRRLFRIEKISI